MVVVEVVEVVVVVGGIDEDEVEVVEVVVVNVETAAPLLGGEEEVFTTSSTPLITSPTGPLAILVESDGKLA